MNLPFRQQSNTQDSGLQHAKHSKASTLKNSVLTEPLKGPPKHTKDVNAIRGDDRPQAVRRSA